MHTKHDDQYYFSDSFLIRLKFSENTAVDGWIVHYLIGFNSVEHFCGIYTEEIDLLKLAFFIPWRNANLTNDGLTAYSGEISKYGTNEMRLRLEWFQIVDETREIRCSTSNGSEVLFRAGDNDLIDQVCRDRKSVV